MGPQLRFEGAIGMRKYLVNLEHTDFVEYKDISSDVLQTIDVSQRKYYAIKIYYAVITIDTKYPDLVPGLSGTQGRKMVVVKIKKDSPWLLDSDESTPRRN